MPAVDAADDRPNDRHVPLDPSNLALSTDIEQVQVSDSILNTAVVEGVKITAAHDKEDSSPQVSSRGASLSTSPDHASDAASIHSMPAVHISEPPPPPARRPSTAVTGAPAIGRPVSTLPQSSTPQSGATSATLSQHQRRARHRSAIEVRSSNRLSGFFNNLIHRRESTLPSPAREAIEEDHASPKPDAERASRSASPVPTPAVPPPPSLPPPSLQELGLSLSIVTSDLSPTHFSTPPSSGAFLAPHYLLLCHAQGLDVLPLTSPPAPQPYALVRRVAFKNVVVMEHRGVLVAIAGRRDGVRVYALEEVKKAIEWRIDVEVRRERERLRREAAKRPPSRPENDFRESGEKVHKASLSTPPPADNLKAILRKASQGSLPLAPSSPPPPLVPRAPRTPTRSRRKSRMSSAQVQQPDSIFSEPPSGQPPPYAGPPDPQPIPVLRSQPSALSVRARARSNSVSHVLAGVSALTRSGEASTLLENLCKSDDWAGSSDDEAIDIRAAASGSQALDERTSATLSASRSTSSPAVVPQPVSGPRSLTNGARRRRPSNLDLSGTRNANTSDRQPSPTPTLLTLRQALQHLPAAESPDPFDDADDDEDENDGRISLAQALLESRIPDLPPPGTVQPQEPILLSSALQDTSSPRSSEGDGPGGREQVASRSRRRRGWSLILSGSQSPRRSSSQRLGSSSSRNLPQSSHLGPDTTNHQNQTGSRSSRSPSLRSNTLPLPSVRSSASADFVSSGVQSHGSLVSSSANPMTSRSSRFIPKIISNALSKRSDERFPPTTPAIDADMSNWLSAPPPPPPAPPPKLEYVKLPGTKGALMIKAVETQKKSFLAILCGENGEKVELFAGTYRTALGLSRTFILPDSPRSLELQLQGDDLVEVFLVFAQNVFGLEPATVRVREVRIGRAERRAARRRARENRTGEAVAADNETNEDDTNASVSLGVSVTVASGDGPNRPSTPPLVASEHPDAPDESRLGHSEFTGAPTTPTLPTDELVAVVSAQMGPYTTFQQLSFAPHFPLASIADEYIIPPTYPNFCNYRDQYEQDVDVNSNGLEPPPTQFSPPGLPIPAPSGPTQWYYKDPKGVMHGPWPSNLMQAWYRDGLLPPDLPVRREGETEYTLLRDLKLQCVDPANPFRSPPAPNTTVGNFVTPPKPLLAPISLLSQPKHFGPPALFFSSRGGHSTAIVDTRGRSVLKGRLVWSNEEAQDESKTPVHRMGDVKHLEALDMKDRSVLIAMRQGGLEAVDLSDALLRPADESRTVLPAFHPPSGTINRRPPYVWKIGTQIDTSSAPLSAHSSRGKPGMPKKSGIGMTKTTSGFQGSTSADVDSDPNDEVLFLGRKEDEIYYCERNAGSFRILRLCPDTNDK